MGGPLNQLVFLMFSMIILGIDSLKEIEVSIPVAVRVKDTITLQCKYDLEGEPLYTVKWYKGTREFYRFIPKELPNTKVFALPGIDVDLSKSTPNEVVLRNVQPEVTGRYKCEVSSDAPNFDTKMNSGYMYVIDAPLDDPSLLIEKNFVDIGDFISGNCTSLPSYPSTNVSWFLNGKRISESFTKKLEVTPEFSSSKRKYYITISGIELQIMESTFQNGKAVLSCVASLFNIYRGERKEILEEAKPRPRPSSVLGPRDDRSVQTCKERWKNIRTVFLRHLRKKTPSGSAGGIKKKYYLEDALQFLIPFVKSSRKQKGNFNLDGKSIVDSDEDDAGNRVQETQEIDPEVQVSNTQPQLNEAQPPETPRVARPTHKEDNRSTALKRKNKDVDAEKSLAEYFEAKKTRLDRRSENADEQFLLSLLPDMTLMNIHQKRRLKREILEAIDKILLEDNSSNSEKTLGPPSVGSLSRSDTQSRPTSSFSYQSESSTQATRMSVSQVSDPQSSALLGVSPHLQYNSDEYFYQNLG